MFNLEDLIFFPSIFLLTLELWNSKVRVAQGGTGVEHSMLVDESAVGWLTVDDDGVDEIAECGKWVGPRGCSEGVWWWAWQVRARAGHEHC